MRQILIFGLGYAAGHLANRLIARGWNVVGTTRDGGGDSIGFAAEAAVLAALRSAVAGVNAGVVGVLFAAWIDPVSTSALRSAPDVAVAVVLVVLLMRLRWTPLAVVATAVAVGAVRALVAA